MSILRRLSIAAITASALALVGILASAGAAAAAPQLPILYSYAAEAQFWPHEFLSPTTLPGANASCTLTAAHPYPVVLVHGFIEDEASAWASLAPLLADNGYCVYALDYGENAFSLGDRIDGLADAVGDAQQLSTFINQVLAQTHARKVDIVGHSLGGLLPSYYMKYLGGAAKVNELVGLTPMNHGSTLEGIATIFNLFPPSVHAEIAAILNGAAPSLLQQAVGSQFELTTFAGGDTVPGPRYVVIASSTDGLLTPYTNAFLDGPNVTNITVQNQCPGDEVGHEGIIFDEPALLDVLNQLSLTPNPSFAPPCVNYGPSGYVF